MKVTKNSMLLVASFAMCCLILTSMSGSRLLSRNDLKSQLIGEWRNVYVKIIIHNKTKPSRTIEVDSTNWEKRMGIQPIREHFLKDGSYYSEYKNLKDSTVRRETGTWRLKGDSVTLTELTPERSEITIQVKIISNDHATFNGLIDFDNEGVNNDEYFGIQKKFKPNTD